jgi:hypothetical protein
VGNLKKLDLTKPDIRLAEELGELLCAVKFAKNKKRNFAAVVGIASKADIFLQSESAYLAGFSKTKEQAKLAMAIMEEMRVGSWTYILFAQGRVQIKKAALLNVLDCFGAASRLKDHTKHCHKIFDRPRAHFLEATTFKVFQEGEEEAEAWRLPCQMLEGHIGYSEHEMDDPKPTMDAVAERRLAKSCPYFSLDAFEVIPNKPKITKGKRYW